MVICHSYVSLLFVDWTGCALPLMLCRKGGSLHGSGSPSWCASLWDGTMATGRSVAVDVWMWHDYSYIHMYYITFHDYIHYIYIYIYTTHIFIYIYIYTTYIYIYIYTHYINTYIYIYIYTLHIYIYIYTTYIYIYIHYINIYIYYTTYIYIYTTYIFRERERGLQKE